MELIIGALVFAVGAVLGYFFGCNDRDIIDLTDDNEVLDRYRTADKKYLTYKKYKDEE